MGRLNKLRDLREDRRGLGLIALVVLGVIILLVGSLVLAFILKLLIPAALVILGAYLAYMGRAMLGLLLIGAGALLWVVL